MVYKIRNKGFNNTAAALNPRVHPAKKTKIHADLTRYITMQVHVTRYTGMRILHNYRLMSRASKQFLMGDKILEQLMILTIKEMYFRPMYYRSPIENAFYLVSTLTSRSHTFHYRVELLLTWLTDTTLSSLTTNILYNYLAMKNTIDSSEAFTILQKDKNSKIWVKESIRSQLIELQDSILLKVNRCLLMISKTSTSRLRESWDRRLTWTWQPDPRTERFRTTSKSEDPLVLLNEPVLPDETAALIFKFSEQFHLIMYISLKSIYPQLQCFDLSVQLHHQWIVWLVPHRCYQILPLLQ